MLPYIAIYMDPMGYDMLRWFSHAPIFIVINTSPGTHGHGPRCSKDQQDVMVEKVPAPGSPHDLGNPHINPYKSYKWKLPQVVPFLMSIPGTLDPFEMCDIQSPVE